MNCLLDTHVLLWWLGDTPELSAQVRELIASPDNLIFVSAASAWEIAIKKALGKLDAPEDLKGALEASRFELLSISVEHAQGVASLPLHHGDPFDRMLISQATSEALTLVTRDRKMGLYDIPIFAA